MADPNIVVPSSQNQASIDLSTLVAGATAAASLAGLALVIPTTNDPSSTQGYQPMPSDSASTSLSFSAVISALFTGIPNTLLFHIEGENNGVFESDITDHYIEDNTTIVDQIGLRPEVITVTGFIGELNDVLPPALQALTDCG